MKYEIRVSGIERKLTHSYELPTTFHAFVEACGKAQRGDLGWFAIKYTNPNELLGFDAQKDLVSVLRLPDGGFVAFWFCSKRSPAVVWCSSEGDVKVVAATWPDFLLRLSKRRTGVPDLDDREVASFPSMRGVRGSVKSLTKERRDFKKWLAAKRTEQPTSGGEEMSEQVRRKLVELMDRHFDREDEDLVDIVNLQVTLTLRSYQVLWRGGHEEYPAQQRLRSTLEKLVEFLGRSLKKSEVSVWSDGCVFVEKNICLGDKSFYSNY